MQQPTRWWATPSYHLALILLQAVWTAREGTPSSSYVINKRQCLYGKEAMFRVLQHWESLQAPLVTVYDIRMSVGFYEVIQFLNSFLSLIIISTCMHTEVNGQPAGPSSLLPLCAQPWLDWNSLCKPDIKGACHHAGSNILTSIKCYILNTV